VHALTYNVANVISVSIYYLM